MSLHYLVKRSELVRTTKVITLFSQQCGRLCYVVQKLELQASSVAETVISNLRQHGLPVLAAIWNESVPIQLAQCRFPGLAISIAKKLIYFSNKICGSDFIKQQSETVMV